MNKLGLICVMLNLCGFDIFQKVSNVDGLFWISYFDFIFLRISKPQELYQDKFIICCIENTVKGPFLVETITLFEETKMIS